MARARQARRCHAHRRDGEPCQAWAMLGGHVCRMHGGASPQARQAALLRHTAGRAGREYARWRAEWSAWQAERVAITAELLGMRPGDVEPAHIGFCTAWYGRPDGPETAPKLRVRATPPDSG